MKEKNIFFKDPDGKYVIMTPPKWIYVEKNETGKGNLHQFQISPECIFQISCHHINDYISAVIESNKILPHDFDLANISFVEQYQQKGNKEVYNWMAQIDGMFYMASYYFDSRSKDHKEVGLELMEVRMALQNLKINRGERKEEAKSKDKKKTSPTKDYTDIVNWREHVVKFYKSMTTQTRPKTERISPLNVDALKLYTLLSCKISRKPNGFFDAVRLHKPLDNPIWWDFILECEIGFIQVWRTPYVVEASYSFDGDFNLESFFNQNINKYSSEIDMMIKNFDRHTVYINHYQSYRQCVETLWKDISEIDLSLPEAFSGHVTNDSEMNNYTKKVEVFLANSIKYHALAKSMVLNAAFAVESFLNLIIRIGSTPELRIYPDILSKFTKQDFQSRIKSLRFYTRIFSDDVDMGSDIYRETKQLMTLRNKYVHYEEDATHNKLGEIYYDHDYPLQPVETNRPAIEAAKKTYHHPDIDTVRNAYETSKNFVLMLQSLIHEELQENLLFLVEQNPIGYNEARGTYSSVYMPASLDFFTMMKSDSDDRPVL